MPRNKLGTPLGAPTLLQMDVKSPDSENLHIAIVGLGYVGLPLAIQFAKVGVRVTGIDIDPKKVEILELSLIHI